MKTITIPENPVLTTSYMQGAAYTKLLKEMTDYFGGHGPFANSVVFKDLPLLIQHLQDMRALLKEMENGQ